MQIGAQMRRTVLLHLKPILDTSKLNIKMQIEMKLYISEYSRVVANCNSETQFEMGDGTVHHLPELIRRRVAAALAHGVVILLLH